jgi:hypothetical protein
MSTTPAIVSCSLSELADKINHLAIDVADARLEFCRAMDEARRRVPLETNMTFVEWGRAYLRKPDGTPWSKWTLYSYASYGNDPGKLDHVRGKIRTHGRSARMALRLLRMPNSSTANQVNALMVAWEAASSEARKQFIHLVGLDR